MADSVTVLQDVGTGGGKKTLAIMGDGFAAGADQTTYNNYVRDQVMRGVFLSDAYNEDSASWNIRRVNLESANSGASTRTWNLMGTPKNLADDTFTENIVDTALDIISNGEWWHNWFETASTTQASIDAALTKWAPGADFVLIVVNSTLSGGLRTGNVLKVTTQELAAVIAHEFGHGFGDLADEYSATGKGNFTAGEPSKVNVTKETDRTKIKWRQYIDPNTPIPTGTGANSGYTAGAKPAGWDDQDDCGLFEGAHTWETGIYRPALNCRMRHNADAFCPPCYSEMKAKHQTASGRTFNTVVAGRFTGSTRSEFFGIDPRGISLYRADGTRWQHVRTTAGIIPGGWGIRPGDTYVAGDFDGDGRDELVVYNSTWWTIPLLGLIKVATDGSLQLIRRFDADIPGWGGFATNDRFLVGDFNGDGRDDLLVTNFTDWVMPYVATLQSTGSGFTLTRRYDGDIPGWGGMRVHDEIYLGDFAGTGRSDLLIWNSRDWSSNYLGLVPPASRRLPVHSVLRRRPARVGRLRAQRPLLRRRFQRRREGRSVHLQRTGLGKSVPRHVPIDRQRLLAGPALRRRRPRLGRAGRARSISADRSHRQRPGRPVCLEHGGLGPELRRQDGLERLRADGRLARGLGR